MKNILKKFILLTAVAVMAVVMTACGGSKYYRLESYCLNGEEPVVVEIDSPQSRKNYIEFTDSNNGVFLFNGSTSSFTIRDGKFIMGENTSYSYTEEGDKLTLTFDGGRLVYIKDEKPVPDKNIRKMVGLYVIDSVTNGQQTEDKDSLTRNGITNYYVNVKDGWNVTFEFDGVLTNLDITAEAFVNENITCPYTYKDGELKVEIQGLEYTFKSGERAKNLIPPGYYAINSVDYGYSTADLNWLQSTAMKDYSIEVNKDGYVLFFTGNGMAGYQMDGTTMSNSTEGPINLKYRQQTAYVEISDELTIVFKRSEKPQQYFPAGSYNCSSIYRLNRPMTEDEIKSEGLENISLTADKDGNISLYYKEQVFPLEKYGNNYYLDGKCVMLYRVGNNLLLHAFGLDMDFYLF